MERRKGRDEKAEEGKQIIVSTNTHTIIIIINSNIYNIEYYIIKNK